LGQDDTGTFFKPSQGPKQLMSSLFQIACGTQNFLIPICNPGIHQRLIKAQERWWLGPLVEVFVMVKPIHESQVVLKQKQGYRGRVMMGQGSGRSLGLIRLCETVGPLKGATQEGLQGFGGESTFPEKQRFRPAQVQYRGLYADTTGTSIQDVRNLFAQLVGYMVGGGGAGPSKEIGRGGCQRKIQRTKEFQGEGMSGDSETGGLQSGRNLVG
jgi:hypothetical protein